MATKLKIAFLSQLFCMHTCIYMHTCASSRTLHPLFCSHNNYMHINSGIANAIAKKKETSELTECGDK